MRQARLARSELGKTLLPRRRRGFPVAKSRFDAVELHEEETREFDQLLCVSRVFRCVRNRVCQQALCLVPQQCLCILEHNRGTLEINVPAGDTNPKMHAKGLE